MSSGWLCEFIVNSQNAYLFHLQEFSPSLPPSPTKIIKKKKKKSCELTCPAADYVNLLSTVT